MKKYRSSIVADTRFEIASTKAGIRFCLSLGGFRKMNKTRARLAPKRINEISWSPSSIRETPFGILERSFALNFFSRLYKASNIPE
jgi:hypothetical protein